MMSVQTSTKVINTAINQHTCSSDNGENITRRELKIRLRRQQHNVRFSRLGAKLSVVHNYDCDVTATTSCIVSATSCDFVFTIIMTVTVMQLRRDCDHFLCEVARGCSQSQCRNRCGRGRPAVASLFSVIFSCFGQLINTIYYLLTYFYLTT